MYALLQLTHKMDIVFVLDLNTIKEIAKESLKQWTYNTHTIASKLKKIREMLLTTLEHNQHDVFDVI